MSDIGNTNTGAFGPTPPGMDLTATQVPRMYGAIITSAIAGTLLVCLRFYSRFKLRNPIGIDDYLITAALITTWATAICTFIAIPDGMGRHMYVLNVEQFDRVWKNLFAYVIIYVIAVSCTKLSIAFFYKRIFASTLLAWPLVTLVAIYPLVVIIVICASCQPLSYFWTQYSNPNARGTCIDIPKFFFANGIWAASIDLVLLVSPIPITWKLQMPVRQKLAVLAVFMLGGFVVVASVVRIIMLRRYTEASDPVWEIGPVYVWSSVEPFIGIICACLPTLSPLFKQFWGRRKGASSTGNSNQKKFLSVNTISGDKGKQQGRFRPDDELMLTMNTQAGHGDEGNDDNVQELSHIHVQKDINIEWQSGNEHEREGSERKAHSTREAP